MFYLIYFYFYLAAATGAAAAAAAAAAGKTTTTTAAAEAAEVWRVVSYGLLLPEVQESEFARQRVQGSGAGEWL